MAVKAKHAGSHVDICVTYGPVTIVVSEEPESLRHFWGELGDLLKKIEET